MARHPAAGPTHSEDRDPYPPGAPPLVLSGGSGYACRPPAWRQPQLLPLGHASPWQQRRPTLHLRPLTAPGYAASASPGACYHHSQRHQFQQQDRSPSTILPQGREGRWTPPGGALAAGNSQGSSGYSNGGHIAGGCSGSGKEPMPLAWGPPPGPVPGCSGGGGGGGNSSWHPGPWPTAAGNHPGARPTPLRLTPLPRLHPAWAHQQQLRSSGGSGGASVSRQPVQHSPMLLDPATATFPHWDQEDAGAHVGGSSAAVAAGSPSGVWHQQQQQGLPSPPGSWHVSAPTTPPAGGSVPPLRSSGSEGLQTCWDGGCGGAAGQVHHAQGLVSAAMQQHHHHHHQSHQPEQLVARSPSHDMHQYLQSFLLEVLQEDEQQEQQQHQQQLALQQPAGGLPFEATGAGVDPDRIDGGEGADGLLDMLWCEDP